MVQTLITVVHVFTCILLVGVVLIQSGKGAEISASFGGSSQTVFGSSGGANFFTRFTQATAVVFMVTSVVLTILGAQSKKSIFDTGKPDAAANRMATPLSPNPGVPTHTGPGGATGAADQPTTATPAKDVAPGAPATPPDKNAEKH